MAWPVNARTSLMMDEAEALYGATITATQGSPHPGVGASFGTHDGQGVIDVVGADLDAIVSAMRQVGFAAWHRTVAEGFTPHVHGVAYLEPDLSSAAADQIDAYLAGRNGLATNAPDDGPRDWVGRSWEDYLAGNPGTGGAPVFRGGQITVQDAVVTAGGLDAFTDVRLPLTGRDDASVVTLTVGDEFYIYVGAIDTTDGDVYSLVTWRLNASGHGTLALADSYDEDFTNTVPHGWTALDAVTVDRDTFALTATPASPALGEWIRLWNGGLMLRVTCVSGTVTLDWACLQVEPPAGLLITSGSHWSVWRTPALVPHTPAGYGVGNVGGSSDEFDYDESEDPAGLVDAHLGAASSAMAASSWPPITYSPLTEGPTGISLESFAGVLGTVSDFPRPFNHAGASVYSGFSGLQWGEWPDYRTMPTELGSLVDGGEVEIISGDPQYEFADGSTVSVRWNTDGVIFVYVNSVGAPITEISDPGVIVNEAQDGYSPNTGGSGAPVVSPAISLIDNTSRIDESTTVPGPGSDFVLAARLGYFDGGGSLPHPTGWDTPGGANLEYYARASGVFDVRVQMPDFRYLVNDWVRSPDALDTSDPEGVIVTWLRQRQRNDGLGSSVTRARGASSRQVSLRQRGYR